MRPFKNYKFLNDDKMRIIKAQIIGDYLHVWIRRSNGSVVHTWRKIK